MIPPLTLGLGIAGNFAGHLAQAGEDKVFAEIHAAPNAPKGIFPWYADNGQGWLSTLPLSASELRLPTADDLIKTGLTTPQPNVQPEPELVLDCLLGYDANGQVNRITPERFSVFNDCSLRVDETCKLRQKKNWGPASKGVSQDWIAIDQFDREGILGRFRLASFLERDGETHTYGVDSPVNGYSYMYQPLIAWLLHQINQQTDQGPLEALQPLLANQPERMWIAIGATAYTDFGETNFLRSGDIFHLIAYDSTQLDADSARQQAIDQTGKAGTLISLRQTVV